MCLTLLYYFIIVQLYNISFICKNESFYIYLVEYVTVPIKRCLIVLYVLFEMFIQTIFKTVNYKL